MNRISPDFRRYIPLALLAAAVFCTAARTADAQSFLSPEHDPHFTVLAAVGYSYTPMQQTDLRSAIVHGETPHFRVQLGYRLHRYVSADIGLASMGTSGFRGIVSTADAKVIRSGEIRALSAEAALYGHLPLTGVSELYVRAGAAYMNVSQSEHSTVASHTLHANGFSPFAGVGAEIDVARHIGFRVGMDWYMKAGDEQVLGDGTINTFYGGFILRFADF